MSQSLFEFPVKRKIMTVTELTQQVKGLFEKNFAGIWVQGEISNFRPASSGHLYFTLKDSGAQLRAVCFRNQARYLRFKPQDGISVIARGHLSVYEARGEYQLYVEMLEPEGLGALQLAFEQLKAKLAAEGLFDPARKKPLPLLPRTVGVVTSPTGAVIRDILRVLKRRFRNMNVLIYPVRVQGEGAGKEIAEGVAYLNRHTLAEVAIVARGGGSLEDLWAFNEEVVARAIAGSRIPVISAVGHETDFTIADFVADLRAPTPSAAAELVVHRKQDYVNELQNRMRRISQVLRLKLSEASERMTELRMHRVFQTLEARLGERAQRVDDIVASLDRFLRARINSSRERWLRASAGIVRYDFLRLLVLKRAQLEERDARLGMKLHAYLVDRKNRLSQVGSILRERSPLVILGRGYSITRDALGNIIRDAAAVPIGSEISVHLAKGELGATVKNKKA
jgi:exodeoxyribonuclease VII large subunit